MSNQNQANVSKEDIRRRHYEVEKELASKLMAAPRDKRSAIFRTMYRELLERVPEHSRLQERESPQVMEIGLARQMRLIEPYLSADTQFLEFAPGTCRLSYRVAKRVRSVIAIDISDQRPQGSKAPDNFTHCIYDGFSVDFPDACADLIFSNQFIEHIHPEDVLLHFQLARRLLRPGGRYVFSTPHLYTGPWDISRGFSDIAEGFHLKEWTCREMQEVLSQAGYSNVIAMLWVKGKVIKIPLLRVYLMLETIIGKVGLSTRRKMSRYLFTQILITATK